MKKLWPILLLLITACQQKKEYNADLLVKNVLVYTVDSSFSTAQAFVVKDGKIVAVGDSATLNKKYTAREVIDAGGHAVYPGFIDAHTHFYKYGLGLQQADLRNAHSWGEVVDTVNSFARNNPDGWIIGYGWDQNLWKNKQFPDKAKLDSLFPVRPVLLSRIDGHAAIANQAALNISGIKPGQTIIGGVIETVKGKLTGILIDNAVGIVRRKIADPDDTVTEQALMDAQRNCFAVGLTTIDDCGLPYQMVNTIEQLQNKGELKMRMYVLLSDRPENYDYLFKRGIIKTSRLTVRGFKMYADGALGSRGACLLQPYSDSAQMERIFIERSKTFPADSRKAG